MPPVSSRTTSRSVPSILSRRSGEASYSAGCGLTGLRFAYSRSPLRNPSNPCSGLGCSGSVVSHFGPPTAASRTASERRQALSTSSGSGVPWASIEAPPKEGSSNSNSATAPSTSSVGAMISGPIPSPGSVRMWRAISAPCLQRRRHRPGAFAVAFERRYLLLVAERDRDVVEAIQEPPADLGVDLESGRDQVSAWTGIADLLGA